MQSVVRWWVAFCCWGMGFQGIAQPAFAPHDSTQTDSARPRAVSILPLPVVSYAPETRIAVGVGFPTILQLSRNTRPTSAKFEVNYTQNKQAVLQLEGSSFTPHERLFFSFEGEWRYFPELYWGIGNRQPNQAEEQYIGSRYALRANALWQALRKWHLFLGPSYQMQYMYNVLPASPISLLATEPGVVGRTGGFSSGVGLTAIVDKRNHILTPTRGFYFSAENLYFQRALGSYFQFTRLNTEARAYITLATRDRTRLDWQWLNKRARQENGKRWPVGWQPSTFRRHHVLAFQARATWNWGDAPFRMLALMGNSREMRGYYTGRFRDQHLATVQAEYRFPLVWRFGAVVFVGAGDVYNTPTDLALQHLKPNYGGGVRYLFNRSGNAHLRADIGFGSYGQRGMYLGFGEVF